MSDWEVFVAFAIGIFGGLFGYALFRVSERRRRG